MKVYIAAPYTEKERVKQYAAELTGLGIEPCMRWVKEPHEPTGQEWLKIEPDLARMYALDDLEDIDNCDVLVLLADVRSSSGGKHVEFGYALKANKIIIVVGGPENLFQRGLSVVRVTSWANALFTLGTWKEFKEWQKAKSSTKGNVG